MTEGWIATPPLREARNDKGEGKYQIATAFREESLALTECAFLPLLVLKIHYPQLLTTEGASISLEMFFPYSHPESNYHSLFTIRAKSRFPLLI